MKTRMKSKRRTPVLLSILCAGLVATFLGGCAESPYSSIRHRLLSGRLLSDVLVRLLRQSIFGTITVQLMIRPSYAPAFATTMHTGRVTTAATFTATGIINLRRAVG